jgi:hypothetical protein
MGRYCRKNQRDFVVLFLELVVVEVAQSIAVDVVVGFTFVVLSVVVFWFDHLCCTVVVGWLCGC